MKPVSEARILQLARELHDAHLEGAQVARVDRDAWGGLTDVERAQWVAAARWSFVVTGRYVDASASAELLAACKGFLTAAAAKNAADSGDYYASQYGGYPEEMLAPLRAAVAKAEADRG